MSSSRVELKEKTKIATHKYWVRSLAYVPEMNRLISGSGDKSVRVWNATDYSFCQELNGHRDWVWCVAVSESKRKTRVATGGLDKIVRVFDLSSGRLTLEITAHQGTVNSVCFSPDGTQIASGSYDKTVRIFELDGREVRKLEDHTGPVSCVAFSPDGTMLASSSLDRTVRIIRVSDGSLVLSKTFDKAPLSIAFARHSKTLAVGGYDKKVHLLDVASGNDFVVLDHHKDAITCVNYSADGNLLAVASADMTASVCEAATGSVLGMTPGGRKGHSEEIGGVVFGSKNTLITASDDCVIRVWELPEFDVSGASAAALDSEMDLNEVD